jgi:hypothetical protein
MSGYLLNTVTVNSQLVGSVKVKAGTLLTDATLLAAVAGAGGQVGSLADPFLVAASANVKKQRDRGQNEDVWNSIMLAASSASALALKFLSASLAADASTTSANIGPASRAGTFVSGSATFDALAATGESLVIQIAKNGTNITGATVTYNHATVGQTVVIPGLSGVAYAIGDEFTVVTTYTAGGSPTLTGKHFTVQLVGQP